jgi:predicted dinucleotide-binding enzyme
MAETIAIIGAGSVGSNLGRAFAAAGIPVVYGLRDMTKASQLLEDAPGARAASVTEAPAHATIVFLCVPAAAAVATVAGMPGLTGKILVDCTNPVAWDNGPVLRAPSEGSVAAALAAAVPDASIVKGFNAFGAEIHADPTLGSAAADVYLASDDHSALARIAAVARAIGFAPVDAGPLRNAALLENLAILWIHLATVGGWGRQFAFKIMERE